MFYRHCPSNLGKQMTKRQKALLIAGTAHAGQQYDLYPYTYHLMQVAETVERLGYAETIVVAAVLHDVIEDTSLSYNDIKIEFGEEIAEIVYAVTDELGRNRAEKHRKTAKKIRGSWKAVVVKLCDRYSNMLHSSEHNPGLFKMYKKELEEFCASIKNPGHPANEVDKAWALLDQWRE